MEEKCDGKHFELKRASHLERRDNAAKIVLFSPLSPPFQQVCVSNAKDSVPCVDQEPLNDASEHLFRTLLVHSRNSHNLTHATLTTQFKVSFEVSTQLRGLAICTL